MVTVFKFIIAVVNIDTENIHRINFPTASGGLLEKDKLDPFQRK